MRSGVSLRPQFRLLLRQNIRLAKNWGVTRHDRKSLDQLRDLTSIFGFSLALGDCLFLEGGWYVTHAGLLRLAHRKGCSSIITQPVTEFCDSTSSRWVFKATVCKKPRSKGFVGYGDADPSNVSPLVRGAELRIAETRATNRALRKALGLGICSVEELGWVSSSPAPARDREQPVKPYSQNGSNNGQPRLRDQLCLLIRQYNLDPTLVKAYAADFCGTQTLSAASRDSVTSFVCHLADEAKEDRDALLCKLNSYAQPAEVKS